MQIQNEKDRVMYSLETKLPGENVRSNLSALEQEVVYIWPCDPSTVRALTAPVGLTSTVKLHEPGNTGRWFNS